jgi:hypothetical protein
LNGTYEADFDSHRKITERLFEVLEGVKAACQGCQGCQPKTASPVSQNQVIIGPILVNSS